MRVLLVVIALLFCGVGPAMAQAEHDGWLVYTALSVGKVPLSSRIGLVKTDGSSPRAFDLGAGVVDPSFSPDGKSIIFSRLDPQAMRSEIATVPVAGGTAHTIQSFEGFVLGPVWSPDQKKIAYYVMQPQQNGAIAAFTMNADGTGITPLKAESAISPRWTRDGRRLAYITLDDKAQKGRIFVADADGSNPRLVVESDRPMLSLAISPDGHRIAYLEYIPRNPELQAQLCTIDLDGTHRSVLTPTAATRMGIEYSADGKTLYTSTIDRVAHTSALVRIPAAGGESTVVIKSVPDAIPVLESGLFFILMTPGKSTQVRPSAQPVPAQGGGR